MKLIEQFAGLIFCASETDWRNKIFKLSQQLGYERTMLAILPSRDSQTEVSNAFVQSNYSLEWLAKYDSEKMNYYDPTVTHSVSKSTPLIWTPDIFSAPKQRDMYEEACSHQLRSGVTLPIHGANGELGMLCLVSDVKPDSKFKAEAMLGLPDLSCFRDFISESSQRFIKPAQANRLPVKLTKKELECLKLCAAGKSSWDIGQILNCSESGANFHFSNIRAKFGVKSRRQALIKAINMGVINP